MLAAGLALLPGRVVALIAGAMLQRPIQPFRHAQHLPGIDVLIQLEAVLAGEPIVPLAAAGGQTPEIGPLVFRRRRSLLVLGARPGCVPIFRAGDTVLAGVWLELAFRSTAVTLAGANTSAGMQPAKAMNCLPRIKSLLDSRLANDPSVSLWILSGPPDLPDAGRLSGVTKIAGHLHVLTAEHR